MTRAYGSGTYGSGVYPGTSRDAEFRKFNVGPSILVEIAFPSGTKYLAKDHLRFSNQLYEGRIISISPITRNMQRNLGIYEISNVTIEIQDIDKVFSSIAEPVKGSIVTIKVGAVRLGTSEYKTVMVGKIDDYTISNFSVSYQIKDSFLNLPEVPITGFVDSTSFPNAFNQVRGMPLPVCYGNHSVTSDQDNRNRGAWPTLYVDNASNAKKFLIACHAVKQVSEVYVNKPTSGSTLLTLGTNYTVEVAGTYAGRTMAWIQFTDAQFTASVADTGGVVGDVRVNVKGKETFGNSLGNLINNPVDVLLDFLQTYCQSPPIDPTSTAQSRIICTGRTYVTKGGYTEKKTTANVLSDLAKSFNMMLFITAEGAIGCSMSDPSTLGSGGNLFDSARDIFRGTWAIDRQSQVEGAEDAQLINTVEYSYDYHFGTKEFFASNKTYDSASVVTNGVKNLVVQLPWTASALNSLDVASRIIFQFKSPVAHANFTAGLKTLLTELGSRLLASHANGHAGAAWASRPLQLLSTSFNPMDYSVSVRGRDVLAITDGAYWFGDESAYTRVSNGTVGVVNASNQITATGATSFITAGVQVGDIIRIKNPTNAGNRLCLKITEVTSATVVKTAQTVWTNESGISYDIIPSWLTASTAQKYYGHLCDVSTGQFSNGNPGFSLL